MEGDGPTAASVLFQYSTIISILTTKRKSTPYQALSTMITTMINNLRQYQKESLHCDPIILATIFNPKFRLEFFNNKYPEYANRAEELFRSTFSNLEEQDPEISPVDPQTDNPENQEVDPFEEINIFSAPSAKVLSSDEEIDQYLSGKCPCDGDILSWWRVSGRFF